MAALMGMLTGIGGGVARDMLLAEIPIVLRSDLYAIAALAGGFIVVIGHWLHLPVMLTALMAGTFCFALRMMAIWRGWHLPVAETMRHEKHKQ